MSLPEDASCANLPDADASDTATAEAVVRLQRRVEDLRLQLAWRLETIRELRTQILQEREQILQERDTCADELARLRRDYEALLACKTFRWLRGPRRAYASLLAARRRLAVAAGESGRRGDGPRIGAGRDPAATTLGQHPLVKQ